MGADVALTLSSTLLPGGGGGGEGPAPRCLAWEGWVSRQEEATRTWAVAAYNSEGSELGLA